jgi:hypothetical protein
LRNARIKGKDKRRETINVEVERRFGDSTAHATALLNN